MYYIHDNWIKVTYTWIGIRRAIEFLDSHDNVYSKIHNYDRSSFRILKMR